jgi:hypothetical protein
VRGVKRQGDADRQIGGSGQSDFFAVEAHHNFRPRMAVRHGHVVSGSEGWNLASGARFSGRVIRDAF